MIPAQPLTIRPASRGQPIACLAVGMTALLLASCTPAEKGPEYARGPGLPVAALAPDDQAAANAAVLRAAFELQPSLSLLADPEYLPRTEGRVGGTPVPAAVLARLQELGVIQGTCKPPRDAQKAVPQCPAELPGYVVRFSEVLGRGDSLQVYLAATEYRRRGTDKAQVLDMERAYKLVRRGSSWQVASEARIPPPATRP